MSDFSDAMAPGSPYSEAVLRVSSGGEALSTHRQALLHALSLPAMAPLRCCDETAATALRRVGGRPLRTGIHELDRLLGAGLSYPSMLEVRPANPSLHPDACHEAVARAASVMHELIRWCGIRWCAIRLERRVFWWARRPGCVGGHGGGCFAVRNHRCETSCRVPRTRVSRKVFWQVTGASASGKTEIMLNVNPKP